MSTYKTFTLKKERPGPGHPVGWTVDYTYKAAPRETARQRAKNALRRDHPREDVTCWEEVA